MQNWTLEIQIIDMLSIKCCAHDLEVCCKIENEQERPYIQSGVKIYLFISLSKTHFIL